MKIYHIEFAGQGIEDKNFSVTARNISEAERKGRNCLLEYAKDEWKFKTTNKWETQKVEWVDTIDA